MVRTALALLALSACLGAQTGSKALDQAARSVVLVQAETAPGQFQQGSGVVLGQGFVAPMPMW